jgi:hypothetical protein
VFSQAKSTRVRNSSQGAKLTKRVEQGPSGDDRLGNGRELVVRRDERLERAQARKLERELSQGTALKRQDCTNRSKEGVSCPNHLGRRVERSVGGDAPTSPVSLSNPRQAPGPASPRPEQ